jgi:hypothetical protein
MGKFSDKFTYLILSIFLIALIGGSVFYLSKTSVEQDKEIAVNNRSISVKDIMEDPKGRSFMDNIFGEWVQDRKKIFWSINKVIL